VPIEEEENMYVRHYQGKVLKFCLLQLCVKITVMQGLYLE
jgi:hypothetical protein